MHIINHIPHSKGSATHTKKQQIIPPRRPFVLVPLLFLSFLLPRLLYMIVVPVCSHPCLRPLLVVIIPVLTPPNQIPRPATRPALPLKCPHFTPQPAPTPPISRSLFLGLDLLVLCYMYVDVVGRVAVVVLRALEKRGGGG